MEAEHIVPELRDAVTGDEHRTVAARVERHWSHVLRTDPPLLGRAIARLPHEHVRSTHQLVRGLLQPSWTGGPSQSDIIEAGLRELAASVDDPQLHVSTGIALLHALRRQGRFREALQLGRQLLGPASTLPETDDNSHVATLHLQVGGLHLLHGQLREAETSFEAAYRHPSAFANHPADAAGRLALVNALRGETARAEGWLERAATDDARATPWPLRATARLPQLCARAMLALDRLDWQGYHDSDDRIDAERIDQDEQWLFVLHHRALAALVRGNQQSVLEELADYRDHHPQHAAEPTLPTLLVETAETALLMSVGEQERALARLDAVGPDRPHLASLAHLLLAGGRTEQAATLSDPRSWAPGTTRRQQVLMLLAHAGAAHQLGRTPSAAAALRQALNLTGHRSEAWLYSFAVVDRDTLVDLARQLPELEPVLAALERLAPVQRETAPAVRLTPRELIVLQHLARGLNIAQTSDALFVSASTVKNQRKSIYRKLGASSREEALRTASRSGLLTR